MKKLVEKDGVFELFEDKSKQIKKVYEKAFKLAESKYWEMFKGQIEKALKNLIKGGYKIVKFVGNDEDGTVKVILKHDSGDSLTWGYVKIFGKIDSFIGISGEGNNLIGIEFLI